MHAVRAALRLTLLFIWFLLGVPIQQIVLLFTHGPGAFVFPGIWHRVVCRLMGIRVIVEGEPVRDRQVIYVGNHLSYLDITVLTSVIPSSFVARGDLRDWPIGGLLARLQQTVFISRSRQDILEAKNEIAQAVSGKKNLIIFAEGTSSDGSRVLPFKSAFFSLALENGGAPLAVQPITLSLQEADGRPAVDSATRDLYAWHGDMTFPPHFWRFAGLKGVTVRVRFHPPRDAARYSDRKALCSDCYADVTRGLEALAQAA